MRADGRQLARRHLDGQIELANVARIDDMAAAPAPSPPTFGRADQKPRNFVHRPLRRRQANPHRRRRTQSVEPRQRQRQGASRACRGPGHGSHRQSPSARCAASRGSCAGQQQIQRFGRRDQNVRRLAQASPAARPAACRPCAPRRGSVPDRPSRRGRRLNLLQRHLQVAVDVVAERLERRDIDDLDFIRQRFSTACRSSRSIATRNAASVLPEPVGAATSVCSPATIRGQPSRCASVGSLEPLVKPAGHDRMKQIRMHRQNYTIEYPRKLAVVNAVRMLNKSNSGTRFAICK